MAVANYQTVNGRIRGESTAGVRTDYLTDALGSVVATANSPGTVVNTYRYKPYGERLAKTGVGAGPKLMWVGAWGYRYSQGQDQHLCCKLAYKVASECILTSSAVVTIPTTEGVDAFITVQVFAGRFLWSFAYQLEGASAGS